MLMLNLTNTSYLNVIDQAQLKTKFANLPYYLHIIMNRLFCKGILSQTESEDRNGVRAKLGSLGFGTPSY